MTLRCRVGLHRFAQLEPGRPSSCLDCGRRDDVDRLPPRWFMVWKRWVR